MRGPNYLARRLVAATVAVVVAAVASLLVAGLLAGVGGDPASASDARPAVASADRVHVARAGESLWTIAEQYRGDVGVAHYVDALVELNGAAGVMVGQAVRLP